MRTVLVIVGVTHHNTLGMIRCVGSAGYRADLILVGHVGSFVTKSRYLDNVYYLDETKELFSFLEGHYKECQIKPIIISCTDQAGSLLDQNYNSLKERFIFFNSGKDGLVTYFMNKQVQTNLAEEVGISIPKSFEYKGSIEEAVYPCLLKPVQSINGGKQVVICQDEKELREGLTTFHKEDIVLVQQFIQKEQEVVLLGLSVNGEITIPGYILKHRDFNGGTLYSTVKPIDELDEAFINKSKEIIAKMNYEGLFGMEFIYSNGKYYFIEVNLRNDATTYALAVAGVNLPELYIKAKTEGKNLPDSYKVRELQSIVEFNDFKHRGYFGVSTSQWLKQCLGAKCKYYFNWKDIKPFFYAPFK